MHNQTKQPQDLGLQEPTCSPTVLRCEVTRTLKLKTFDKWQGWQTLETFGDFESASKRAKELLASNPLWTTNNLRIVYEL